jgi:triosephosphate isomerase
MIIVANWKANVESVSLAKKLVTASKKIADTKKHLVIIAPSATHLGLLSVGNKTKLRFAAQDISETLGGAETGEITAGVVAGVGATHVLIGHSERRALGETDDMLLEKVRHALAHGLIPILCVGEQERDAEAQYLSKLRNQISVILTPLSIKERAQIVIAYEPIWAIGKHASEGITPGDLTEMVSYMRKILSDLLPGKASEKVAILYGGAVESANVKALSSGTGIDGLLVGHISADPTAFTALARALG